MSEQFSCPRCGARFALTAALAGRPMRCSKCGIVFNAPPLRGSGPVAKASAPSPAQVPAPAPVLSSDGLPGLLRRVPVLAWFVGGAVLVSLVVVLVLVTRSGGKSSPTAERGPVAQGTPSPRPPSGLGGTGGTTGVPSQGGAGVGLSGLLGDDTSGRPGQPTPPTGGSTTPSTGGTGRTGAGAGAGAGGTAGNGGSAGTGRAGGTGSAGGSISTRPSGGSLFAGSADPGAARNGSGSQTPVVWTATTDASTIKAPLVFNVNAPTQGGVDKVLYPKPFQWVVGVVDGSGCQVWDLRRGARMGGIRGKLQTSEVTLSPDGKYILGSPMGGKSIEVWAVQTEKSVATISPPEEGRLGKVLGFVGNDAAAVMTDVKGKWRVQVWDLKAAAMRVTVDVPLFNEYALSANGVNLAVSNGSRIELFDLVQGKAVGVAELARDAGSVQAMEFSPDGVELAAMVGGSSNSVTILSWDMKGKLLDELSLTTGQKMGLDPEKLSWLPDRSGWMAGYTLIDRQAGRGAYTLPRNMVAGADAVPRMAIDTYHVFVEYRARLGQSRVIFQGALLPKVEIERAITAARAEAKANQTELPPAIEADRGAAQPVVAAMDVEWSGAPDPTTRPTRAARQPVPLRSQDMEGGVQFVPREAGAVPSLVDLPRSVHFADAGAGMAVVEHAVGDRPRMVGGSYSNRAAQKVWLERCDLNNARPIPPVQVPREANLLAVSADGQVALLRTSRDRVDLWSLAIGQEKQICGWVPAGVSKETRDANGGAGIRWGAIVDSGHVLVVDGDGVLCLWEVPSCRPVWSLGGMGQGLPRLSPGRRYVAAPSPKGVAVFESLTGRQVGLLPASEVTLSAISFQARGDRLAGCGQAGGTTLIAIWDLKTGKTISEFPIRNAWGGTELAWVGSYLRVGDLAVDVERRLTMWQYQHPVSIALGGNMPDDRWWYMTPRDASNPACLVAAQLPHEAAKKAVAEMNFEQQLAVRPGMKISLEVGTPDGEQVRKDLVERLKEAGYEVAENQQLRLVASYGVVSSEQVQYRAMFGGGGQYNVTVTQNESKLTLQDNGQVVWETAARSGGGYAPSIVHLREGQSVQEQLQQQVGGSTKFVLGQVALPRYIFKKDLPPVGSSRLGMNGITGQPR